MFSFPSLPPIHDFTAYLPHHSPGNTAVTPEAINLDQARPSSSHNAAAAYQRQQTQARARTQSALAQLKSDEEAIKRRKENIARFGSTWIRPPGISKTLQAETEERLEREEQEQLAAREQMLLDMQARQEQEEARARREAGEASDQGDDEGEEEERDLDDEVPEGMEGSLEDADEDQEDSEMNGVDEGMDEDLDAGMEDHDLDAMPNASNIHDEGDDGGEGGDEEEEADMTAGDVSFNEISLIEGSMLAPDPHHRQHHGGSDEENSDSLERILQERNAQMQEAELTGAVQEEYDLGMAGNLDDSVPEAGSYEHTDTELDDEDYGDNDNDNDSDNENMSDMEAADLPAAGIVTGNATALAAGQLRRNLFDGVQHGTVGQRSAGSTGSRPSIGAMEASSLLESSFVASSPVVGRLRSDRQRGGWSR